MKTSKHIARGFSLLEVMVALAILGLSLTVILSAQGGLAASNRSAANMGQAAQLARCKMTEIEENLLRLGYQEIDQIDNGVACCLDATPEGFTCDTKVEKIVLPNASPGSMGGADGGVGGLLGASSAMVNPAGSGGLNLNINNDAGLAGLGSQFGSALNGAAGGAGAEGLLSMVMGMLYPSIKPMYEQSIRKISVTVRWKEGPNERELPLTQFVTNPARGGFSGSALMADGGVMDFAPPVGSGAPGTTTPGTTRPGAGLGGGAGGRP